MFYSFIGKEERKEGERDKGKEGRGKKRRIF